MLKRKIPVYMINGFLESGKTQFLQFTIGQPYFHARGVTLLLVCEEGMEEYDEELLKRENTVKVVIEEEKDFSPESLLQLELTHRPERIIVEWNGMWNFKEMKLPKQWFIEQQITMIDATTIVSYFNNMKSMFVEMFRASDMIVINRCTDIEELKPYRRSIKAVNGNAEIIFEDEEGELETTFEEDLPYDVSQPFIDVTDEDFGIWFIDVMENPERYLEKDIRFKGMVLKPEGYGEDCFIPGRMAMTCCADDMAFLGYICKSGRARELKNRQWVQVRATLRLEYHEDYQGKGPVLYADSVERTLPPAEEIISFQ